ncbi:MAG TPA: potassium channel family protein [Candidatus Dormibacteraeota bacterium]|nr:potassium channel family protein [Candidatus Dormibacteraeota bacterium]
MEPGAKYPHPLRRMLVVLLAFLGVILYGTIGYLQIEHYPLLDAVFMTITSITTVGFEEVHPLDGPGEVFTITLVVLGVAAFLYTFGVLVELLSGGRWRVYRRFRSMEAQLHAMRDHVIVCGYGRTGKTVVEELKRRRVPYIVVEMNPTPLEAVRRDGELHVVGDAANDDVLHFAGLDRARALVSAVDSDERNVYIVLTARSLSPSLYIVARSSYPDSVSKLERAGADRVVSPYTTSGMRMAALAMQPAVVDVLDIVTERGTEVSVEELLVPASSRDGITAGDLRRSGATLLAVRDHDGTISVGPADSQRLTPEDILVAMGTREQLDSLAGALRPG